VQYTLSLHDALPILLSQVAIRDQEAFDQLISIIKN
jgi:hypothetical protein